MQRGWRDNPAQSALDCECGRRKVCAGPLEPLELAADSEPLQGCRMREIVQSVAVELAGKGDEVTGHECLELPGDFAAPYEALPGGEVPKRSVVGADVVAGVEKMMFGREDVPAIWAVAFDPRS